jgi:hypothetical protein
MCGSVNKMRSSNLTALTKVRNEIISAENQIDELIYEIYGITKKDEEGNKNRI